MDPGLTLWWQQPALVAQVPAAVLPAPMFVPGWLPMGVMTNATRAGLAQSGTLPRHLVLSWTLEAAPQAWDFPQIWPDLPADLDVASANVLMMWAHNRLGALGVSWHGAEFAGWLPPEARLVSEAAQPLRLALGRWPWLGPILVVPPSSSAAACIPAGQLTLHRPVLPLVVLPRTPVGTGAAARSAATRAVLAAILVDAALPAKGSPPWLRLGLTAFLVAPIAESPRSNGEIRAQAGRAAIDNALLNPGPQDARLLSAIAAWCLDPRRAARLPDLLRHPGRPSLQQFAAVYGNLQGFD